MFVYFQHVMYQPKKCIFMFLMFTSTWSDATQFTSLVCILYLSLLNLFIRVLSNHLVLVPLF